MAQRRTAACLAADSSRPRHADHRYGGLSRGTRRLRIRSAAPARGTAALDHRAHGTWHSPNGEPTLLRTVQPRPQFSGAVRGPHRRPVQSSVGEFRFLPRAGGAGKPRGARPRTARRLGSGSGRAFCHRRVRVELHRPALRPDRRSSEVCRRRRARVRRSGEVLYLARLPHCMAENRAPGRSRPYGAAPHRYRRPRPDGQPSIGARHRRGPGRRRRARDGGGHRRHDRRRV